MANAARCFGLYDKDKIVGFIGVMHFPHPRNKKIKRVTRLVILPDYQGIGLGTKFLKSIATFYAKEGFDFRIVTSAKNLIYALNKNPNWKLKSYEKGKTPTGNSAIKQLAKNARINVKIASFLFVKKD
ncbi:GNAT family N-acetyltransferase [Paraeggerthella sp. LCP19S3_G8]|uniref:GNAT family N-acetyltransferase n=1 Tax=Paraeggerthella sp. LCP19S3_G8 TaxID=3440248 RepID=UPI003F9818E8